MFSTSLVDNLTNVGCMVILTCQVSVALGLNFLVLPIAYFMFLVYVALFYLPRPPFLLVDCMWAYSPTTYPLFVGGKGVAICHNRVFGLR
jgi:hypothetical protein